MGTRGWGLGGGDWGVSFGCLVQRLFCYLLHLLSPRSSCVGWGLPHRESLPLALVGRDPPYVSLCLSFPSPSGRGLGLS